MELTKYGVFNIDVVVLNGNVFVGVVESQYPSVATKFLGTLLR